MTIPVHIAGHNGTGGVVAEVTARGQLITAPLAYSVPFVATADVVDTAFNLVGPKANRAFVVTDIVVTGTKSIDPNTDATVIIYEAASDIEVTVLNTLMHLSVPRSGLIPLTGLNIITENEGIYINIKTDDATVLCTLMGYHVGHHHEI